MIIFSIKRENVLPVSIDKAWMFFSNPKNLIKITPPEMDFRVLTENLPEEIYSGMMIQYAVSPARGLKFKWLSEIRHVKEPHYFIDEQRSGPYSFWYHQHSFSQLADTTLMKDEVHYSLPFSFLGSLANSIFVKQKLNYIFEYRSKSIDMLFNGKR